MNKLIKTIKKLNIKWKYLMIVILGVLLCGVILTKEVSHNREIVYHGEEFPASSNISISELALMKGSYDVSVQYETSTDSNRAYFLWGENTYGSMKSDMSILYSLGNHLDTVIWVEDSRLDYSFHVDYDENSSLLVSDILIQRNMKREIRNCAILLVLIAVGILVDWLRRNYIEESIDGKVLFGLVLIGNLSFLIYCTDYLQKCQDLVYHLTRIEEVKDFILSHKWTVSISGVWSHGYGYPSAIMYNDLFLVVPAVLRLLGFDLMFAYKSYVYLINLTTCFVAYYSFNKILKDRWLCLLGSAIYTLSSFRIFDLARHAVGEYTAMTFLPLIITGIYLILESKDKKSRNCGILCCVLGYSGIISSHVITLLFVAVFSVIAVVFLIDKIWKKDIILDFLKMIGVTILVNLWWFVPFFDYFVNEKFNVQETTKIQKSGIQLVNLFLGFDTGTGMNYDSDYAVSSRMTWNLGLPLCLGVVLFLYFALQKNRKIEQMQWRYIVSCICTGLVSAWMTTVLFPFDKVMQWFPFVEKLFGSIQFTWRMLAIATVLLTVGTCAVIQVIKKNYSEKIYVSVMLLSVVLVVVPYFYQVGSILHNTERSTYRVYDMGGIDTAELVGKEYLIQGTDTNLLKENQYTFSDGVVATDIAKEGTTIQMHVENESGTEGYVEVPLLNYKGYVVKNLGDNTKLTIANGSNNTISVAIPSDFSGVIQIKFVSPWYWVFAEIVSIVTVLSFFIMKYKTRICKKNKQVV